MIKAAFAVGAAFLNFSLIILVIAATVNDLPVPADPMFVHNLLIFILSCIYSMLICYPIKSKVIVFVYLENLLLNRKRIFDIC